MPIFPDLQQWCRQWQDLVPPMQEQEPADSTLWHDALQMRWRSSAVIARLDQLLLLIVENCISTGPDSPLLANHLSQLAKGLALRQSTDARVIQLDQWVATTLAAVRLDHIRA